MLFICRLLRSSLVAAVTISASFLPVAPLLAEETAVRDIKPRESGKITRTGKERLAGKSSDEQRVNDCKVPVNLRGSSLRSATCSVPAK